MKVTRHAEKTRWISHSMLILSHPKWVVIWFSFGMLIVCVIWLKLMHTDALRVWSINLKLVCGLLKKKSSDVTDLFFSSCVNSTYRSIVAWFRVAVRFLRFLLTDCWETSDIATETSIDLWIGKSRNKLTTRKNLDNTMVYPSDPIC